MQTGKNDIALAHVNSLSPAFAARIMRIRALNFDYDVDAAVAFEENDHISRKPPLLVIQADSYAKNRPQKRRSTTRKEQPHETPTTHPKPNATAFSEVEACDSEAFKRSDEPMVSADHSNTHPKPNSTVFFSSAPGSGSGEAMMIRVGSMLVKLSLTQKLLASDPWDERLRFDMRFGLYHASVRRVLELAFSQFNIYGRLYETRFHSLFANADQPGPVQSRVNERSFIIASCFNPGSESTTSWGSPTSHKPCLDPKAPTRVNDGTFPASVSPDGAVPVIMLERTYSNNQTSAQDTSTEGEVDDVVHSSIPPPDTAMTEFCGISSGGKHICDVPISTFVVNEQARFGSKPTCEVSKHSTLQLRPKENSNAVAESYSLAIVRYTPSPSGVKSAELLVKTWLEVASIALKRTTGTALTNRKVLFDSDCFQGTRATGSAEATSPNCSKRKRLDVSESTCLLAKRKKAKKGKNKKKKRERASEIEYPNKSGRCEDSPFRLNDNLPTSNAKPPPESSQKTTSDEAHDAQTALDSLRSLWRERKAEQPCFDEAQPSSERTGLLKEDDQSLSQPVDRLQKNKRAVIGKSAREAVNGRPLPIMNKGSKQSTDNHSDEAVKESLEQETFHSHSSGVQLRAAFHGKTKPPSNETEHKSSLLTPVVHTQSRNTTLVSSFFRQKLKKKPLPSGTNQRRSWSYPKGMKSSRKSCKPTQLVGRKMSTMRPESDKQRPIHSTSTSVNEKRFKSASIPPATVKGKTSYYMSLKSDLRKPQSVSKPVNKDDSTESQFGLNATASSSNPTMQPSGAIASLSRCDSRLNVENTSNALTVLCTESILDSWSDVIAELVSGRSLPLNHQTPDDRAKNTRFNGVVLIDTPLMGYGGVDIEVPGRYGILLVDAKTTLQSVEATKVAVLNIARLAAIGRYRHIFVFVCIEGPLSREVAKHLIQFQCASMPPNWHPETMFSFQTRLRKDLASSIAEVLISVTHNGMLGNSIGSAYLETVSQSTCLERAILLQTLVPVLCPCGALEILDVARRLMPKDCPFFQMLFKNPEFLIKIESVAKLDMAECSIHPSALKQLNRVVRVPFQHQPPH